MKPPVTDAISFVSEVLRHAYWEVYYNQDALKKAHAKLKLVRELARQLEIDHEVERAETNDDGDVIRYENLSQFVMEMVDDEQHSLEYHEAGLISAHNKVAYALTMLARGNYTEIDADEVQRQSKTQFMPRAETEAAG